MDQKLAELEQKARHLEPGSDLRKDWAAQAFEYANTYIKALETAKAFYADTEKDTGSELLDISEHETPFAEVLETIAEKIDPSGINASSGMHFGYIPGGGLYPSALGDFMADVSNRYAGVYYAAPRAVELENRLIRWLCDIMDYPKTAAGNLTSGGSMGNLIALVTAREACNLKARDIHKAVIYCSTQAHHSLQKAIRITGLAEAQVRYIPVDENLRIIPDALEAAMASDLTDGLKPFFLSASLGTTNTGAIDPINPLGKLARKNKIWFHVDAAYGGFFKLVPHMQPHFDGIDKADSITLDPHKTLFLPYGSGAVIVRERKFMFKAHSYTADYMQDSSHAIEEISPADISPELTKPFRGMRLWLPLKLYGVHPFRAALEEKLLLAQYAYEQLKTIPRIELGPKPQLSVTLFRYIPKSGEPETFNKKLTEAIQKDGRVFLSSTQINGVFWIRIAIVVFRSHKQHIDACLGLIRQSIEKLENGEFD